MLTHEDLQHLSDACRRYDLKVSECACVRGVMQTHLTGRIRARAYREGARWSVAIGAKTYQAETPIEAIAAAITHISRIARIATPRSTP